MTGSGGRDREGMGTLAGAGYLLDCNYGYEYRKGTEEQERDFSRHCNHRCVHPSCDCVDVCDVSFEVSIGGAWRCIQWNGFKSSGCFWQW